jgi:hypothetical protein
VLTRTGVDARVPLSTEDFMRRSTHFTQWLLAAIILTVLAIPQFSLAAGAKKYQVTGTVLELTDDTVTVQKADGEKWELNRDAKAVVKGELKVGAKVTIQYTMTVASVEVKPAK